MESPFRQPVAPGLELFETLRWEPDRGLLRGEMHLARMARSARALGMPFAAAQARAVLAELAGDTAMRVRLALRPDGRLDLKTAPYAAVAGPWRVAIATERVTSTNPWRGVKTTRRELYDRARAALPKGLDELLFLNESGTLAEGTITNLFVTSGKILKTPPLSAGCLPGVLRQELLEQGRAQEAALGADDLAGAKLWVGNSLRGLIPAQLVAG